MSERQQIIEKLEENFINRYIAAKIIQQREEFKERLQGYLDSLLNEVQNENE